MSRFIKEIKLKLPRGKQHYLPPRYVSLHLNQRVTSLSVPRDLDIVSTDAVVNQRHAAHVKLLTSVDTVSSVVRENQRLEACNSAITSTRRMINSQDATKTSIVSTSSWYIFMYVTHKKSCSQCYAMLQNVMRKKT